MKRPYQHFWANYHYDASGFLKEYGLRETFLAEIPHRNTVHVWCLNTEGLSDHEVASACAVLSPEEQVRQRQLHFPEDRRDFASAHALLRKSLSLYSDINPEDWRFKVAANGKPYILRTGNQRQKPFSFSLSHARG